jgi:D-glycero-D-manno-heptose 1,7-bisphosphate phosphatase
MTEAYQSKLAKKAAKKAVFLDRDGTIIRDMIYLNDPTKIEVFKESYPALKLLHDNGYLIVLVTNQSGVARGVVQLENLHKINDLISEDFGRRETVISAVYYCPHPVDGGCECRKPNAGMLKEAAIKYEIDLSVSWMIGDRMTDVECGRRAGCRGSILLQNETTPPIDPNFEKPNIVCRDVLDAAELILRTDRIPTTLFFNSVF